MIPSSTMIEEISTCLVSAGRAAVDQDKVIGLAGDASTRQFFRVNASGGSYIFCKDERLLEGDAYPLLDVYSVLRKSSIPVAEIYHADTHKGFLLIEDLGDETLLRRLPSQNIEGELSLYTRCLEVLLKMHSLKRPAEAEHSFFELRFDVPKLMFEVDFAIKHFLRGLLRAELSAGQEIRLRKDFEGLCALLASREMVLSHRDFHSRNIMIHNGTPFLIDYQDARMGLPQYDLISLLNDCYYSPRSSNKERLRNFYWENWHEKSNWSREEFMEYLDLMGIQRIFKALGSFGYLVTVKGDQRYRQYIGHSIENWRKTIQRYPQYEEMGRIVSGFYYAS
jgi:aminoglycoside/choline kinase family phosphotransferase